MIYATYDFYTQSYDASIIPEEVFQRFIVKASAYIDMFTFERINEGNVYSFPSLSFCACEMAEVIYHMLKLQADGREKKSEDTDGYSVTYVTECVDGQSIEETLKKKLFSIAKLYLSGTGLLYCGTD